MKHLFWAVPTALCMFLSACINNDYDLSKIDKEMTLFSEEGIEIPIPDDTEPTSFSVLEESKFEGLEHVTATVATVEDVVIKPSEIQSGVSVSGEFGFDFSSVPDILKSAGSSIKFDDNSFFSIFVNNEYEGNIVLSCELFDGRSGKSLGTVSNVPVSKGSNVPIKLGFSSFGLKRVPETALIKNIVLKEVSTKEIDYKEKVLGFVKAQVDVNSIVKSGSTVELNFHTDDLFKEYEINTEDITQYLDATSLEITASVTTDIPAKITATVSGSASAEASLDGPCTDTQIVVAVKCDDGIKNIKALDGKFVLVLNQDVDMSKIDQYDIKAKASSIKMDQGIKVNG